MTFFVEQAAPHASVQTDIPELRGIDVPVVSRASSGDCIGCIGTTDDLGFKGSGFTVTAWLSAVDWRTDPGVWFSLLSTEEDAYHNRMFIGLDEHNSPTMSFSTKDDTCVSADPPPCFFRGLGFLCSLKIKTLSWT